MTKREQVRLDVRQPGIQQRGVSGASSSRNRSACRFSNASNSSLIAAAETSLLIASMM